MDIICLNGEFVPLEDARVPATDAGLLAGHGVFETLRVELGHVCFAHEHFARLSRGLRVLGIPYHLDPDHLLDLCHQVLDANALSNARLRLTITAGPSRNMPMVASEGEPTFLVTAVSLDRRAESERERGWRVVLTPHVRNARSPLATVKCTSYVESILARRHAHRLGFDEGLLLNADGLLAEGAMTNIFAVTGGGELLTPRVDDGALPGIMRAQAMRLASAAGLSVRETAMSFEQLALADEAFATNAIVQIMPVVHAGERPVGTGTPGPVTLQLHAALRAEIDGVLRGTRG